MRNLGAVVSSPPKGSQPGAVGRVDRWSETVIAFARLYPCGIETVIAFAGEKWAFLVHFACAEVMPVSAVPCWGCAVVLLVSMSPRCRVVSAKKVALCTKNGSKSAFSGVQGEFFAEESLEGPCWASFVATTGTAPVLDAARCTSGWLRWGFCSIRSFASACCRRVGVPMMQFPPWGDAGQILEPGCMLCAQQFRMQFPCDSFKI